jgi:hypothetical protein
MSHIAARQEVRDLLKVLQIPAVDEKLATTGLETRVKAPVAPAVQQEEKEDALEAMA